MAPVMSKGWSGQGKGLQGESLAALLGSAALEQLRRTCDDLCEVALFLQACVNDVGQALDDATAPLLEPLAKACVGLARRVQRLAGSTVKANPSRRQPLAGAMPMMFVGHVLSILYSAFVFAYLPAAGLSMTSPLSILFHSLIFMILSTYVRVYTTNPGSVPQTAEWMTQDRPPSSLRETKADGSGARWCRKTGAYKPDRAHYCKVLGQVVLRMDHHCPWMGNTIGWANHKFFVQFLLYSSCACVVSSIAVLRLCLQATLPPTLALLLLESQAVNALLASLLVPFCGFHCWLLSRNMTTIEFCEHRMSKEPNAEFRYDLGTYRNLVSVLGDNPLTWFLPVGSPSGDGLSFQQRGWAGAELIDAESGTDTEAAAVDIGPETASRQAPKSVDAWVSRVPAGPAQGTVAQDSLPTRSKLGHGGRSGCSGRAEAEVGEAPSSGLTERVLQGCICMDRAARDAAARLVAICAGRPSKLASAGVKVTRAASPSFGVKGAEAAPGVTVGDAGSFL